MQSVFENSLMQHHVALPPDAMGKITYIAPHGQYSLKVCIQLSLFCKFDNQFCFVPVVDLTIFSKILSLTFLWELKLGTVFYVEDDLNDLHLHIHWW